MFFYHVYWMERLGLCYIFKVRHGKVVGIQEVAPEDMPGFRPRLFWEKLEAIHTAALSLVEEGAPLVWKGWEWDSSLVSRRLRDAMG